MGHEDVADVELAVDPVGEVEEFLGLLHGFGERFFDEDMQAFLQSGGDVVVVGIGVGADGDGVRGGFFEGFLEIGEAGDVAAEDARQFFRAVVVPGYDPDVLDAFDLVVGLGVEGRHESGSHIQYFDAFAHEVWDKF